MSQRILTRCLRYTSLHRYCVKLNAPPKFSRSIHLRCRGRARSGNRVGGCENAKGSIRNTAVCSPRKKKAEGRQRCVDDGAEAEYGAKGI